MRNTFFGNLPGRFEGSGARLFAGVFLLWLIAVLPFAAAIVLGILGIDWSALATAAGGDELSSWLDVSGLDRAVVYAGLTGIWLLLSFAILLPIFRPMVSALVARGLRFGDVTVTSHLLHRASLRRLMPASRYCIPGHADCRRGGRRGLGWPRQAHRELDTLRDEIITPLRRPRRLCRDLARYATIHQATASGSFVAVLAESSTHNIAVLDQVSAAGDAASPVGEGPRRCLGAGGV